eukprot:TRINITY_DN9978_c0_g1_i1.p1 TRINITY_DN9978_c0_g1~~TRINITY_DN9978_c0_g1_i1.p1  ORF type:complete len:145 (+),score=22.18 TRINITY_DN9978_c0_g1_i1:663-1097(+)
MLDTVGPELQVFNKTGNPTELKADDLVTITTDISKKPSADVLPINYSGLAEVLETKGSDVICLVKDSATLAGFIFTVLVSQVHISLPTLTDTDKKVISTWGSRNNVDFVSLSYTHHVVDVREEWFGTNGSCILKLNWETTIKRK